ncbi:LysR family transcriptional regulator [Pelagibius sp. Alg239-R121]|uniref:LysR family transcriptional regulator n=1 Tax=Pelagibius sp. Alg239-R121 TaxID=2993448 RepID=UPI0024A69DE9|nr:LysR family transcriptional regulator [Pelagibius sp. Alg239-R121]
MDTIEGMRSFAAVAAEGSFTGGGKRLGLSTKLVSKYVRQLEERLGVQLLNRTTRSVALTDVGRVYYERCLSLLDAFDEVEAAVQDRHRKPRGKIRMTAPTSFGERDLTRLLAGFLKQEPEISIDLELTNRHVSLVDEGFDLGLRISSLTDSTMIARKLAPMRVVICAAPDYLDKKGRPDHPAALATHDCIIDTNFRVAPNWPFRIDGTATSVTVKGRFHVNTPRATAEMAAAGLGIALCPHYAVQSFVEAGQLELLFVEYEAFDFGIHAIYPHNRHLTARVRALVDYLAKELRQSRG